MQCATERDCYLTKRGGIITDLSWWYANSDWRFRTVLLGCGQSQLDTKCPNSVSTRYWLSGSCNIGLRRRNSGESHDFTNGARIIRAQFVW